MFIVKIFNNNVLRETVFYDINKAISFFEDIRTYHVSPHARLYSHMRVVAEF